VRLPEELFASAAGVLDARRVVFGPVLWVLPEEAAEVVVPSGAASFWPPGLQGTRCVTGAVRGPAPDVTVLGGASGRVWLVPPDLAGGRRATDPEALVEAVCTSLSRRTATREEGLVWAA